MGAACCSTDHIEPLVPVRSLEQKNDFCYRVASPQMVKEASKSIVDPSKKVVEAPGFLSRLRKFNCIGRITREEGSNSWTIKLDKHWQDYQDSLRKDLSKEPAFQKTDLINPCVDQAKKWAALLGLEGHPHGWFTPTSKAGMHITLGVFEPEDRPVCISEGKTVKFSITNFSTMLDVRPLPMLNPGQLTFNKDDLVLIHCPTRWFYMEVDFQDFNFNFECSPHVSLACYGLKDVPLEAVSDLHASLKSASGRHD